MELVSLVFLVVYILIFIETLVNTVGIFRPKINIFLQEYAVILFSKIFADHSYSYFQETVTILITPQSNYEEF